MNDRNLLLGVLALRMDFINSAALLDGLDEWFRSKHRSLGEILLERQALTADRLAKLEMLLAERQKYDGDEPIPRAPEMAPTLPIPRPRFSILRSHRHGGLGEVFLAHDEEVKREVALKQINERYADHPEYRARFIFEAEVTGRLEHPGVVPVYGMGYLASGRPYYAMRFVRGEAMRETIRRFHQAEGPGRDPGERSLQLREILSRFLDVCDTVAYAHSRGVLHRDLKPDNVLLGPFGETLVVDWGLAKVFEPGEAASQRGPLRPASAESVPPSRVGQPIGTLAYMAPEQAAGLPDEIGPHTDIYGLGAVLFEILAGRPPHRGFQRTPDPPHAAETSATTPAALDAIAARAMMPRPADRWPTATALGDAVRRWLADEPVSGHKAMLAQLERLTADHPDVAEYRAELARHRVNLALVLEGMGRYADGEAFFREAVADYDRLASAAAAETRHRADLATTRVHLSRVLRALGRTEEAGKVERAAVADYERLRETSPHDFRTGLASVVFTLMPGVNAPDGAAADESPSAETKSRPAREEPVPEAGREEAAAAASDSASASDEHLAAVPVTTAGGDTLYPVEKPASAESGREPVQEMRGRFTLLRELARGGGSIIWIARDNDLNREVVIKQLPAAFGHGQNRFLREAQIAAQLEHPNIAPIYGLGHGADDRSPFFIQRYVRGPTLRQAISEYHDRKTRDSPGASEAQSALRRWIGRMRFGGSNDSRRHALRHLIWGFHGACKGLAFAHSQGVLHRDPKPANIIVNEQVGGVIVDWGLARVEGETEAARPVTVTKWAQEHDTVEGQLLGTPAYMAPEMAKGRHSAVDVRTDVYVLGAGLYELLTGRPPYRGGSPLEMLSAILTAKQPQAREADPSVPAALNEVCARAMARRKEDRYSGVRELGRDMERWLGREGVPFVPLP